jgi:MFS family permease
LSLQLLYLLFRDVASIIGGAQEDRVQERHVNRPLGHGRGCTDLHPCCACQELPIFLLGLFVQGTGMALLQTASNPYVTIIGPRESAAKRISMMGIANKFAGAIAPIILGRTYHEGLTRS